MSDFNFPYGTRPPGTEEEEEPQSPLASRMEREKLMQWQVLVADNIGKQRLAAFMAGAAERAAADTFDPSAAPEDQARFKAEMYSGSLSPARTARRRQSLPPEEMAAYDEHVAAINLGRAAYDAGAAAGKQMGDFRLSGWGQVAQFGQGSAAALDIGGLLTAAVPDLKDDQRKLYEQATAFGRGESDFGPRVQALTGLLPPERQSDLFFKGAQEAYSQSFAASPWAAALSEGIGVAGGLSGFVAGPGGLAVGAGRGLARKAVGGGLGAAAKKLIGVGGAAAGYGAYHATLPFSPEEQQAIDHILEKEGEGAADEAAVKLRTWKVAAGALTWPVMEIMGGAGGALGRKVGGKALGSVAEGMGIGAGMSQAGIIEDLPQMRAVSEAIIGKDPGVRTALGQAIEASLDPERSPEEAADAWIKAGVSVGVGAATFGAFRVGAATFGAFHAFGAFKQRVSGRGREPDADGFAQVGRENFDLNAKAQRIEEILAARARQEMRSEAPELERMGLVPVSPGARDVRVRDLVGGEPVLSKEESLARGPVGPLRLEGKEAPPPGEGRAAAIPGTPTTDLSKEGTVDATTRREMLAQDEAAPPTGDVAKDAASRWRNDESRWIAEQEQTTALAEYQREVDAYDGGKAPRRPSVEPPPPEGEVAAKPTEALPGVPMEEPPRAGKSPETPESPGKPGAYRPEETDAAFDLTIGGKAVPVSVRPSESFPGKVEVSIPSPLGEGDPYVVIAPNVRDGVKRIAEHWEGTVKPRSRLGEDVVKATREKAATERTEAQKKAERLAKAEKIVATRRDALRKEREAREAANRAKADEDRRKIAEGRQGEVFSGFPGVRGVRNIADALFWGPGAESGYPTRYRMNRDLWAKRRGVIRRGYNQFIADIDRAMGPLVGHEVREFEHRKRAVEAQVLREFKPFRKEIKPFSPESAAIFDAVEGTITMAQAEAIAGPNAPILAKKLQRTFEKFRRWWVRVSPRARELKQAIRNLDRTIARAGDTIRQPGVPEKHVAKARAKVRELTAQREQASADLKTYQDTWGITGGKYMPHFFEELLGGKGGKGFSEAHAKLVKDLKGKVGIHFGKLKHREGAPDYIRDVWTALDLYSHGFIGKILGERMHKRLNRLVHGKRRSLGKTFTDKKTKETRDPLIEAEGSEVYHGVDKVKIIKVDRKTKDTTIRLVGAGDASKDEVLPQPRARRELTKDKGGLKEVTSDKFMEREFEKRVERILGRHDRFLESAVDRIVTKVGRGLMNHMYAALLMDPKVAATNYIAGQFANYAQLGAKYYAKGQAMATRAAWGAVQEMMGKKPTGKTRWALEHIRRMGTLSDSEYHEYIGKPQAIPSKVKNLGTFLRWAREHAPILFQLVEKINRSGADFGAYMRDMDAGKKHPEAMAGAYESVARTQFMYMASMSPQMFNVPGARFAFALGQVPFRQWNAIMGTVHEAITLDAAKGWKPREGLLRYLNGESDHWHKVLRHLAVSMAADALLVGMASLFGYASTQTIGHLFGTRAIDIAEDLGGHDVLDAVEATTGIPKERLIMPGPLPGFTEGGVGVSLVRDTWDLWRSEEHDKLNRYLDRVMPLLISRIPAKAMEYFTAKPDPDEPGKVTTTYPFSDKTKRTIEPADLLWQFGAGGTPISDVRDRMQRALNARAAKRDREFSEEANTLEAKREKLMQEGKYGEADTLLARIDQIEEITGRSTNASVIRRKLETQWMTPLERSVALSGSQQVKLENLIRYAKRPETSATRLRRLETAAFPRGMHSVKSETMTAYFDILAVLDRREKKGK